MSSEKPHRDRSLILLLGLLALSAAVLIGSAVFFPPDTEVSVPSTRSQDRSTEAPRAALVDLERSVPGPPRHEDSSESPATLVQCRERETGAALRDVRLYRSSRPIAGPSDSDGSLRIEGEVTGVLTLWASGWVPITVRGERLPEEVLFDPSTAALEVRLLNSTSEHHVLRSLVQPHRAGGSPDDPWVAPLTERAPDVFVTEQIAPGSYDVYLWMTLPDRETRTFSRNGVEVEAGGTAKLSFDMTDPRDPEEFESDS